MRQRRKRPTTPPPEPEIQNPLPRLILEQRNALERTLRSIEVLITCHPQAAATIVRLLVREGRAFGEQPTGRLLMSDLSQSEWVERGRVLWEACGLDSLLADDTDKGAEILPSTWISLLRQELTGANLEQTISRLMFSRGGASDE